tara:strand:+ start:326 stop:1177 length:852 start_codon:yes stop_codon:yes gene_type:complete
MSIKLTYVYNKSDLEPVISFLQSGFKWSKKRSDEIMQLFTDQISSSPMGAYRKEDGELKIAILLFDQSNYFNNEEKVISLCSMYAEPSHRGIPAINFARILTEDLKGFTITNYSSNYIAYKIWKSVGWEHMKVKKIQLGFRKKFPFYSVKKPKDLFDYSFSNNINYKYIKKKNEKNEKNEKNKKLVIHYILRQLRIKNKFFKINIIDFYINKKEIGKIPFWSLFFHTLKNRGLQINIFINSDDQFGQLDWHHKKLNWLIKNSKNFNEYVLPLGSEICIKTGIR